MESLEFETSSIGPMIWEVITGGIHAQSYHAIREYVQNEIGASEKVKIRQQLQFLRDEGVIDFLGDG